MSVFTFLRHLIGGSYRVWSDLKFALFSFMNLVEPVTDLFLLDSCAHILRAEAALTLMAQLVYHCVFKPMFKSLVGNMLVNRATAE
jgi:hypothetical protein